MKKSKQDVFTDIYTLLSLRMRQLVRDKALITVFIVTLIIFSLLVRVLTLEAEELSSLPVGVVDHDQSQSSKRLVEGLERIPAFRVLEQEEGELHKLLLDERIIAIFVIGEDYEDRVKTCRLTDSITMYYKKDNKAVKVLADIAAGEMLYDISLYKGYRYYRELESASSRLSEQQYRDYIGGLLSGSEDFDFAFDIVYENQDFFTVTEASVSNTILYNQFIIGIFGILIAFLVMFQLSQAIRDKESGIDARLRITGMALWRLDAAELLSVLILEGVVGILFTGMIIHRLHITDWRLWLSAYLLYLLYVLVIGLALNIITKLSFRIYFYQIFASIMILLAGGMGFYRMLSGFYQGSLNQFIKIIPNNWFIQGFTDIIIYGGKDGYLGEGHMMLLVIVTALFFLTIGTDIFREKHRKR